MRNSLIIASIVIITILGFSTKLYSGPAADWVNNSLGGVFYVIFFALIGKLIFPGAGNVRIVISVFAGTSIIEFLQLWHPPFLEWARSLFLGRTLLGNSFSWSDIFHYAAAGVPAYLLLKWLEAKKPNQD